MRNMNTENVNVQIHDEMSGTNGRQVSTYVITYSKKVTWQWVIWNFSINIFSLYKQNIPYTLSVQLQ